MEYKSQSIFWVNHFRSDQWAIKNVHLWMGVHGIVWKVWQNGGWKI